MPLSGAYTAWCRCWALVVRYGSAKHRWANLRIWVSRMRTTNRTCEHSLLVGFLGLVALDHQSLCLGRYQWGMPGCYNCNTIPCFACVTGGSWSKHARFLWRRADSLRVKCAICLRYGRPWSSYRWLWWGQNMRGIPSSSCAKEFATV